MAALNLREDQTTGQLILEPRLGARLVSLLSNLAWVAVFAIFFLVPSFADGQFNPESVIIFLIILIFSLGPSLSGLLAPSVSVARANRSITSTTRLLFIPVRSTTLSFSDLANIEVQSYRASSRRSIREVYRVNAVDRADNRLPLNWDGQRDEMIALAQKISAITGAPLLDHAAQPVSTLTQVIEMAKNLGLPLPQETTESAPESSSPQEHMYIEEEQVEERTAAPAMPAGEGVSIRDLSALDVSELEQRVASDSMDSDARYALARKYHARGQFDRAIELYQATLQIDTTNAEAQNDLGAALLLRGKRTEAEAAYRRAIALDPFSFTAHLNLALFLRSMNRAAEASQEFFQARQNARSEAERQIAESAGLGSKMEPRLSA